VGDNLLFCECFRSIPNSYLIFEKKVLLNHHFGVSDKITSPGGMRWSERTILRIGSIHLRDIPATLKALNPKLNLGQWPGIGSGDRLPVFGRAVDVYFIIASILFNGQFA